MTLLATFKHISSKNADYGAAEAYLTFEHDEFTMKPTLDENGRLIPREDYRISSLNCGDGDFAVACMRANLRYEKNQKREDVKSHHYIISFDPRDGTDNGLTVDRAQELGEQFCKAHFPGHQALVCTHPDGHNHSGNIHVHIVINSLRIYEVPLLPYMDRPADTREGCKHRCTNAAMEYFKSEVMEMCHREGLYQIDLLNGSKERITEREYWAAKKGQLALDKENAVREAAGQPTKPTKFETDKAKLRRTIRQALSQAGSFDEFSSLLLREGVTVKESRGRLSYLTPDRTKPITARKLGDDFDKAIAKAAASPHREDKTLLWFCRPSGTHCFRERDVFLKDTAPHNTWRFYMEQTSDRVLAYAIELTGKERGKIKGNLYELDYSKHYERVKEKELPADTVKLIYEHGERVQEAGRYFDGTPDPQLGKFERFEAVPNDPDALQSLLQEERRSREQLSPGDFKAHIAALRDGLIETEARRIVREMKRHYEPNSPNKTHFMAELSPAFMRLAATKDTDRLFSMLPYKTLSFSKIEGRHGTYALIDKGENRDREIRKPRPSIRAQLKADKAKTAPKKAAAKTKNHDMEV